MEEAKQISVEVSRATAAAEEAQGKGSVDGIMEVQEVTESSGPLQPKSLNRLASAYNSAFRQRRRSKEKSKLEQVVIQVDLDSSKAGYLASKLAAEIEGVESVKLGGPDRNLLEVIGDGVDAVHLVTLLRRKVGSAEIISKGPVKEPMKDIMEDEPVLIKEEENEPVLQPPVSSSSPYCLHPISESAVDIVETKKLNGAMEMETTTKTHSNLSLENAESSCKTKTTEWTLLITSLLLEAISAIFDQLGYALIGMVMAFVALLLSVLDLIHKAREKGITCNGRSLLPCFYRHSSHDFQNRKPFGSLVEYFGFAGAVWQCSYTTVGYHYTRQKLNNPIKICLLPFIFALCVLISKLVRSSQHESARVFLLGPSHHYYTPKCALSTATVYETPIGDLPIDLEVIEELKATGKFELMDLQVDEAEHSMEMHLPYLAKIFEGHPVKVVPILVGALHTDDEAMYGRLLAKYVDDPTNFFSVSSDFCHWGSRFHYTHYDKKCGPIHKSIEALDRMGMDIIETGNADAFKQYLSEYDNTICGRHPISVFLHMSRNCSTKIKIKFLRYEQSSQCKTMRDSSVSYASAAAKVSAYGNSIALGWQRQGCSITVVYFKRPVKLA
ncbi:hypothetical protein SADUNF_Sadunf18G0018300 [Salix dunnii]|uniref:Protein MEMO1 n=1 Tax=Salix dunnii TaxID=1413687 RepID=A0A835J2W1_9ROSI|nr:hypothetical protein SADUNF_Sadunf18G0018300 [Salix dunnii]